MPSHENFYYETPPRIMGSETEYTTQGTIRRSLSSLTSPRHVAFDVQPIHLISLWMRNGARFYMDAGDMLEYATPECTSANEVALYERTGEIIASDAGAKLNQQVHKRSGYLPAYDGDGEMILFTDSTGHHENYFSPIDTESTATREDIFAIRALSSYLATRPIWSGAGIVGPSGYGVSQKGFAMLFPNEDNQVGEKRALHTDRDRLEIRSGEGNMSEWAITQKFALTSLVLRLIEHDAFPSSLLLEDGEASQSIQRLSHANTSHKYEDAADHQSRIAQVALDFALEHPEIPEEETHAAHEIIIACDNVGRYLRDPSALELIDDRIDWAAKLSHMHRKGIDHDDVHSRNLTAVMHDLKWEDIDKRGVSRRWYAERQPSIIHPDMLKKASTVPPTSRAHARTELLMRDTNKRPTDVDWNNVVYQNEEYHLSDPYGNNPPIRKTRL